jgi:hypothetical protein
VELDILLVLNTNAWHHGLRLWTPRWRSIALLDLRPGERLLINGAGTGADLDHMPADASVTATTFLSGDVGAGTDRGCRPID